MSHPINGDYVNGDVGTSTINLRISSHDEASGRFSGTLFENQYTPSPTTHYINGWFTFHRNAGTTDFSFETPTDTWVLRSPHLETAYQFTVMNATRTPKDQSQLPQNLVLHKTAELQVLS
ncbi:hypothetical protein C4K03_2755 [Pseudomonas synxantha]|uniref:Uncharacterized protein n=1 Tax=Pseudomonas synxantha TaxID=47883 RepID=A0A3G7U6I3_9PSED|nr:hypothetical protein C4K03_2755 [Pseudomonas synxantha]